MVNYEKKPVFGEHKHRDLTYSGRRLKDRAVNIYTEISHLQAIIPEDDDRMVRLNEMASDLFAITLTMMRLTDDLEDEVARLKAMVNRRSS
jgi:hypothetical protein